MKNRLILSVGIFLLTIISTELFSQSLTLVGDAKLSLTGEGTIFSAPSIKLRDNSQIIQAEAIKLPFGRFIELLSPDALLKTRMMQKGDIATIKVGIGTKTGISIINRSTATAYSIGMESGSEPESLPYFWKVTPLNEDGIADLQFSWTKEAEPEDFELKSLVRKEGLDWLFEDSQEIQDTSVQLKNHALYRASASAFTISTVRMDTDNDGVPDIQEIREGSDTIDPTDYLDTDGDLVPDYIEGIQNTNPLDPISYLNSNGDGVPDYVRDRSPVMFINISDIEIPWGFTGIDAMLPDSLVAVLGSGIITNLGVTWDKSTLDIFKRGNYQIIGDYTTYPGLFDAYELPLNISVTVLPKPAPQDVNLSVAEFEGKLDNAEILIGEFVVIDPVDNIHEVTFIGDGYDNKYFEIRGNKLYWISEDKAAGKTVFTIIVRVTDRDGNTFDKFLEITRLRESVKDITVYNVFSPNGDNINDTWGVPEMRFYEGVRIQVFDRGGVRMFITTDPDQKWDGTENGNPVPVGTYFWTIEVQETGEIRKGMLNVLKQ
ncbi:gliding motility-associated C-terminal domain-containing protein [Aquiflexum gelatinilyticum]|uniref:gliding motility-associated C-terminal domain-containing protein n=1 Tax=Aquiflexum gelatinilyticum TaxID=2961943 RepID=UPI002168C576|nr:gliding motility-associated C-terminal domain-containing protein [Aquiflexum gelatinilyticum]MCS4435049.1 gliding motility-associated C-terminal domain-containing protein [Aquiflexum gelatinilyticum]